jgi:limonene-1,2-epoxide hydrolase
VFLLVERSRQDMSLVTEDFSWPNMALPKVSVHSRSAMRDMLLNQNMGFPEPIESGHHETVNAVADNGLVLHERVDHWVLRGSQCIVPVAPYSVSQAEKSRCGVTIMTSAMWSASLSPLA